jgi:hypothetical protein
MNVNLNQALIVTGETALNGYQSGASLRVDTINRILSELGYSVKTTTTNKYLLDGDREYKLIILTPFTAAKAAKKARKESQILWMDYCDSGMKTRFTRIFYGEPLQMLAIIRDLYYSVLHPKYDLKSFISSNDAKISRIFANKQDKICIVPNTFNELKLNKSVSKRFIFVGDGFYGPNKKAIIYLSAIFKKIKGDYQVLIVGRNQSKKNNKFQYIDFIDDKSLYCESDIHLAPIFSGAGIKNKVVIPLMLGITVLTTPHGAKGLKVRSNLRIAKSRKQFREEIETLLQKEIVLEKKSTDLYDFQDETAELCTFLREISTNKVYFKNTKTTG